VGGNVPGPPWAAGGIDALPVAGTAVVVVVARLVVAVVAACGARVVLVVVAAEGLPPALEGGLPLEARLPAEDGPKPPVVGLVDRPEAEQPARTAASNAATATTTGRVTAGA
jgi:hypothetical protein